MLFEISRNWGTSFQRFSIGALAIFALDMIGLIQIGSIHSLSISSSDIAISSLVGIIAFFTAASVLGMLVSPLGNLIVSKKVFSEDRRMNRAFVVGQSQNPLLIEACRDAEAKAEIAKSVMGLVTFVFLVSIFWFFWGDQTNGTAPKRPEGTPSDLRMGILGAMGAGFGMWLEHVASKSLLAIENVMNTEQVSRR